MHQLALQATMRVGSSLPAGRMVDVQEEVGGFGWAEGGGFVIVGEEPSGVERSVAGSELTCARARKPSSTTQVSKLGQKIEEATRRDLEVLDRVVAAVVGVASFAAGVASVSPFD